MTKRTRKPHQPMFLYIRYAVFIFLLCSFPGVPDKSISGEWEEKNDLLLQPAAPSQQTPSSLLLDITKAGSRLVTVGEQGHILYSNDHGKNWQQADVPVRVTLTGVYFPTAQNGWAVGHDGVVLHTQDGGQTWIKQMDGREGGRLNLEHAQQLLARKKLEVAHAEKDAKAALKKELEEAKYELDYWQAESQRWGNPLLDVWFKNSKEGFVIGAYGRFYKTVDGGKTWMPAWDRIENPNKWHLNAFASSGDTIFIAGESGTLYRSRNMGKNWERIESPYDGSYLGIVASQEKNLVIAYGIGAKLAFSRDGGNSWNLVQTRAGAALSGGTFQSNDSVAIISYSGIVLTGPEAPEEFISKKIGSGWEAIAETDDNHIVLVGLKGLLRTAL